MNNQYSQMASKQILIYISSIRQKKADTKRTAYFSKVIQDNSAIQVRHRARGRAEAGACRRDPSEGNPSEAGAKIRRLPGC